MLQFVPMARNLSIYGLYTTAILRNIQMGGYPERLEHQQVRKVAITCMYLGSSVLYSIGFMQLATYISSGPPDAWGTWESEGTREGG